MIPNIVSRQKLLILCMFLVITPELKYFKPKIIPQYKITSPQYGLLRADSSIKPRNRTIKKCIVVAQN